MRMPKPFSRRFFIVGALLWSGAYLAHAQTTKSPHVLFVCLHGSVKSPIAREHLRRMAAARGFSIVVESRGIAPEDGVSAGLNAQLAHEGIDPRREPLMALTAADIASADVVVIFNPLPNALAISAARDWSDIPSMNDDYAGARAILLPRLSSLLDEIVAERQTREQK